MKKTLGLSILLAGALTANAQYEVDGYTPRLYGGLHVKAGGVRERVSMQNLEMNYTEAVRNYKISRAQFDNKTSLGFDFQIGYFVDRKAHFGIATGIMYNSYEGTMTVDEMHVEYKSADFRGDVFRQSITATSPIVENYKTTSLTVPLVFKYRTQLSRVVGIMIDAGVLYNLQMKTDYDAASTMRYEAVYKYQTGEGGVKTVYDRNITPEENDWLITVDKYKKDKGDGNEAAYFQSLRDQGYNVSVNENVKKSGTFEYQKGSFGVLLQPSFTFRLNKNLYIDLGAYYMYQEFGNTDANRATRVADKIGTYNSYLNNAIRNWQNSYGGKAGLSVFL